MDVKEAALLIRNKLTCLRDMENLRLTQLKANLELALDVQV